MPSTVPQIVRAPRRPPCLYSSLGSKQTRFARPATGIFTYIAPQPHASIVARLVDVMPYRKVRVIEQNESPTPSYVVNKKREFHVLITSATSVHSFCTSAQSDMASIGSKFLETTPKQSAKKPPMLTDVLGMVLWCSLPMHLERNRRFHQ